MLTAHQRSINKFEQLFHGRKRLEFSKIFGERRGKTVTLRIDDAIIGVIMSAPKCSQTSSLLVIVRWWRNTWLFVFNKLVWIKVGLSKSTVFATVVCQQFGMAG